MADRNFSLHLDIDFKKIEDLYRAIDDVTLTVRQQETVFVRGINEGVDRLYTQMKRSITSWAGANRQKQITAAMSKRVAYASSGTKGAKLEGAVVVKDKWTVINTADFSASFSPGDPSVKFMAWGNPQEAKKAFMLPGIDVVFKRVGTKRWDIKPLWGPNAAKEVKRHEKEVQGMLEAVLPNVLGETMRQVKVVADQAKAKHGL